MSTDTPTRRSKEFAKTVIPLMKEFGQKLESLAVEARRIQEESLRSVITNQRNYFQKIYQINQIRFQHLKPAVSNLARHVSQRIEHGAIDDLTRLELELRLAEFEDTIRTTEAILKTTLP